MCFTYLDITFIFCSSSLNTDLSRARLLENIVDKNLHGQFICDLLFRFSDTLDTSDPFGIQITSKGDVTWTPSREPTYTSDSDSESSFNGHESTIDNRYKYLIQWNILYIYIHIYINSMKLANKSKLRLENGRRADFPTLCMFFKAYI